MFFQDLAKDEIDTDNLDYNAAVWLNKYRKDIAAKTTLRRITSIRNLGQALGVNLLKGYKGPKPGAQTPHPLPNGKTDLEKLLGQCRTDDHKIIVTLTGYCGLRITEAREIGPHNFIYPKKTIKFLGKGSQEREVPCSPRAWEILLPYACEATLESKPTLVTCSDKAARSAITALGKRAKLSRPISSHDLRATFATEAYRKTKDIRAVQMLLGHSSVAQTQLYVLSDLRDMRAAASFAEEDWDESDD